MAHLIDHAALWAFSACSAFLLMLSVTRGNSLLSAILAFLIVCLLRAVFLNIPASSKPSKKQKLRYADSLIHQWILMPEKAALQSIQQLLPSFFEKNHPAAICLLQCFPGADSLTPNVLLQQWRRHSGKEHLVLIATCPADSSVHSLLSGLSAPSVTLIDSPLLRKMIVPSIHSIPEEIKKERPEPFKARIARCIKRIHPVRTSLYLIFFLAMYVMTGSVFYLTAVILLTLMLTLYVFSPAFRRTA